MTDRRLAMAALDPNAAIAAAAGQPPTASMKPLAVREPISRSSSTHVLDVEIKTVGQISRWRFLVFWLLIRLAARVFGFGFEIRRARDSE